MKDAPMETNTFRVIGRLVCKSKVSEMEETFGKYDSSECGSQSLWIITLFKSK